MLQQLENEAENLRKLGNVVWTVGRLDPLV